MVEYGIDEFLGHRRAGIVSGFGHHKEKGNVECTLSGGGDIRTPSVGEELNSTSAF